MNEIAIIFFDRKTIMKKIYKKESIFTQGRILGRMFNRAFRTTNNLTSSNTMDEYTLYDDINQ